MICPITRKILQLLFLNEALNFYRKKAKWSEVDQLLVSANAPSASFTAESNWVVRKWNDFEMNAKGKYNVGGDVLAAHEFLASIPDSNNFVFGLGNKIPSLGQLTVVDSKVLVRIHEPRLRYGKRKKLNSLICN